MPIQSDGLDRSHSMVALAIWASFALSVCAQIGEMVVENVAIEEESGEIAVWAEIGIISIRLPPFYSVREGNLSTCPLETAGCQPQGLTRVICGRRIYEPYAFLSSSHAHASEPQTLQELVRLGTLNVVIPLDCPNCRSPCCQVCDWAATQALGSPMTYSLVDLIQKISNPFPPSNATLLAAIILSLKTPSPSSHPSHRTDFNPVRPSKPKTPPTLPCTVHILPPSAQTSPCIVSLEPKKLEKSSTSPAEEGITGNKVELELVEPEGCGVGGGKGFRRGGVDTTRSRESKGVDKISLLEAETFGTAMGPWKSLTAQFFGPVASAGGDLIGQQVGDAITGIVNQIVRENVGSMVQEMVHEMVTDRAWPKVLNYITDEVVKPVTMDASKQIGDYVLKNLNKEKAVSEVITYRVVQRTIERVLPVATSRTSAFTVNRVVKQLSQVLSKGLSHSITASLVSTLSNSPLQDYYCYMCSSHKLYCAYCQHSSDQLYYAMYYAGYYSTYYSLYYAAMRMPSKFKTAVRREEDYLDELEFGTDKGRPWRRRVAPDKTYDESADSSHVS